MKAKPQQHELDDQGLGHRLDSLTRDLLSSRTLKHYIDALAMADLATANRIGKQEEQS